MRRLNLRTTIILVTFLALCAMATRAVVDTDLYWHLAAGRYIVEMRSVPTTDPFSSTMLGKPWVDIYWLAQAGWYLLYQAFGPAGLSLLVTALVMVSLIFVWKQLSGPVFLRALIVILVAVVSGPVWTARPHLMTYLLTAVTAYLIYLYKWKQLDRLWVIPLVVVLWVNVHGGYIAGFMLLGAVLAGEIANHVLKFSGPEVLSWQRWRKLLIITLVSGLVLLINPYTVQAVVLPFKTVNIGVLQDFIQEWASPNFHELYQQPLVWMLLLTLVVIGWSGRRLDASDAAVLVVFAYISFLARRNVGLFALVCAPVLSRHVTALIDQYRWGQRRLSNGNPILNWIIVVMIGLAVLLKMWVPLAPGLQQQAEAKALPVGAANWIAQQQPAGLMFNSYNWGGYLLWRLWPRYPDYIDGRTDLYDNAFSQEYLTIAAGNADAPQLFDERGINLVVVEQDSRLAVQLLESGNWQAVYRDDVAVVLTRRA
jgi:hypothetical protein